MTARRPDPDHPREPVLSDADSAEVGRHIAALAQTVEAPPALRMRLADADAARARAPRRSRGLLAAAGGALAAVLVALAVLAGGSGPAAPTLADASAVALAGPTDRAPAVAQGAVTLPVRIGGIDFPNYAYQWPAWKAVGTRRDTIAGRDARTVIYRSPVGDVGYTIVDGKPLAEPQDGRSVTAQGTRLRVVRRDGATIVTWRRNGHTCVLAARGRGAEPQLVQMATWA